MTVITMTREMGTLGKDVAAGVAERLGLKVVHHEVVERDVAGRLKVDESDVHRFLEGSPSLLDRWKIDQQKLSRFTAEEIYQLAADDNVVIRGWGATTLLRRVPSIPRVRVCAPMDFRVRVLQERLDLKDERAAQREIERNDAAHTRAMRAFSDGTDWKGPLNYDLVLNTDRLPIDDCVEQVVALTQSSAFADDTKSRRVLDDLALEARVRSSLATHKELGLSERNVDITVSDGDVVISGAVQNKEAGEQLCRALRSVPKVRTVTNNLFQTGTYHG